jgi:hypothetical protein
VANVEAERTKLKQLDGGFAEKLGGEAGGIPVLPGFDEAAVLDAHDGSAGDVGDFAGGEVFAFGEPVDTGEVAFGKGQDRGNLEIRENAAQAVVEFFEFGRAADDSITIVDDTLGSKELGDRVPVTSVPDFLKPADDELFVLIERGYSGGGHRGYLLAGIECSIQESLLGGRKTIKISGDAEYAEKRGESAEWKGHPHPRQSRQADGEGRHENRVPAGREKRQPGWHTAKLVAAATAAAAASSA